VRNTPKKTQAKVAIGVKTSRLCAQAEQGKISGIQSKATLEDTSKKRSMIDGRGDHSLLILGYRYLPKRDRQESRVTT